MHSIAFLLFLAMLSISVIFVSAEELLQSDDAQLNRAEELKQDLHEEKTEVERIEEEQKILKDKISTLEGTIKVLKGNYSTGDTLDNANTSLPVVKATNISDVNGNHTTNTSSVPSHRWPCKSFNVTEDPATIIINNETLYSEIFARMNTTHGCGLLLFYSPHCEFCTNLAPLYNAVGRSYSSISVMAVDAQEAMGMAARYGVVGIPTIFFFHSGRAVAKFNRSQTPIDFQKFIKDLSGYSPIVPLNITAEDMDGPIITRPKESRDYYMIFSVSFLSLYIGCRLFGGYLLNFLFALKCYLVSLFTTKEKEE